MPLKVLFDSNFLMVPAQFHIDIFQETELILNARAEYLVLPETLQELQRLVARGGERGRGARHALKLAARCHVLGRSQQPGRTTDDVLLRTAQAEGLVVATNDSVLRRRLRRAGIPVIYVRKRAYLAIHGSPTIQPANRGSPAVPRG